MVTSVPDKGEASTAFNGAAPVGYIGAALERVVDGLREIPKLIDVDSAVFKLGIQSQHIAILAGLASANMGVGFSLLGGAALIELARSEDKKREKEQEEATERFLFQQLMDQLQRINEQIAWHQKEINRLDEEISLLNKYAKFLEGGGTPELNPDGSLKDKRLEQIIRAHEDKYNTIIDRTDPSAIREASEAKGKEHDDYRTKVETLESEKKLVEDEIERANSSPEQAVASYKEMKAKAGEDVANTLAAEVDNEAHRSIVENKGLNHINREYELATTQDNDFFSNTTIGSDNPFSKGDMPQSFAASAAPVSESLTPEAERLKLNIPANTA